jgi:hypothetical protein
MKQIRISALKLIELRGQFDRDHFQMYGYFWNSLKIIITLITAMLSIQSGFLLYFSYQKGNPGLLAIPIGIFVLCGIGYYYALKEYKSILEYISCVAKIDDELGNLQRKKENRTCFPKEDSILPTRWLDGRRGPENKKHDTVEDFVKYTTKYEKNTAIKQAERIILMMVVADSIILSFSVIRFFGLG